MTPEGSTALTILRPSFRINLWSYINDKEGFRLMKEYTTEFLRNVAMVSHGGAGKTMLAEALLHFTGATTRLGKDRRRDHSFRL